jgi:hypothetical protein
VAVAVAEVAQDHNQEDLVVQVVEVLETLLQAELEILEL